MICAVAGMTADANILINTARVYAQQYLYAYNDDMPCEQLVKRLCDLKQGYTQTGGMPNRPPLYVQQLIHFLSPVQVFDPLASRLYGLDMIVSTDSNFTNRIHRGIMEGGKLLLWGLIMPLLRVY